MHLCFDLVVDRQRADSEIRQYDLSARFPHPSLRPLRPCNAPMRRSIAPIYRDGASARLASPIDQVHDSQEMLQALAVPTALLIMPAQCFSGLAAPLAL